MKTVLRMAAAILLLGCTCAPRARSLSVGMAFQDAECVLKAAGAKEVQMDMLDQTATDFIKSYKLADGRVLVVAVSKSANKVSALTVCKNPEQAKSMRTWDSVKSLALTAD